MIPNPNVLEIAVLALRNRSGELADNVSNNNAILRYFKDKGKGKERLDGGRTIFKEIDFAQNTTAKWYSGYDLLDVSASTVFTAAEFPWKQAACVVTVNGLELSQVSGKEAVINLMESRITNAKRSMANIISQGIYSDGSGGGGKEISGLRLAIADDPTLGTYGGIDRAANPFWRNQVFRAVTDGGAPVSASNIQSYMNQLFNKTRRGMDYTDLIVADPAYYNAYWNSLTSLQRFTSTENMSVGTKSLKFQDGIDVVYESLESGILPNRMYFLNTDYLFYSVHKSREFVPLPERSAINQDAMTLPIVWMGNLTGSNMARQGVLNDL